ncbi:MAG: radical SAM protein [Candidatus Thiodiazotropha sp.]
MSRYLIRREHFGATVYDPVSTGYFFLNRSQYSILAEVNSWPVEDTQPTPPGDDPSQGRFDELFDGHGKIRWIYKDSYTPLPKDCLLAPVRVYFELTTRCNGTCRYCLNNSGTRIREPELTTNEAFQVIKTLGRDGVFEVRLTGGEVTLRADFFDLAQEVRTQSMALSINSNLLLGQEKIKRLIDLQPDLLITSLDASERAHISTRGPGYDRIKHNVKTLREAEVPVRLNCLLSTETLPDLSEFIDYFAALGCGFCFILERPVGRAGYQFNPPPLSDLIVAARLVEAKRLQWPEIYFNTSFHVVMDHDLILDGIDLTGCNAIQKSFNINSDGQILPCAFLYEMEPVKFSLGNVRDYNYSVLPIWRTSPLLRQLRNESAECNRRCISCNHFHDSCLGSCIMMSMYAQHTGQPDPYCRLSQQAHDELSREVPNVPKA